MRLRVGSRVKCIAKDCFDARGAAMYGKVGDVSGFAHGRVWVDFGTACRVLVAAGDLRNVTKPPKRTVDEPIGLQMARDGRKKKKRWKEVR